MLNPTTKLLASGDSKLFCESFNFFYSVIPYVRALTIDSKFHSTRLLLISINTNLLNFGFKSKVRVFFIVISYISSHSLKST